MCVTLTDENFDTEVLDSRELVLVVFSADWCGPCHMIAPVIEELSADFEGQAKMGKLNIDQNAHVAAQYGIRSTPTLLFFKDGQIVDQVVGVVPKRVVEDKLQLLLRRA